MPIASTYLFVESTNLSIMWSDEESLPESSFLAHKFLGIDHFIIMMNSVNIACVVQDN